MESVTGTELLVEGAAKPQLLNPGSFQSNKKQVHVLLMQRKMSHRLYQQAFLYLGTAQGMSKFQNNWKLIFFEERKTFREVVALENGRNMVFCFRWCVPSQCYTFLGVLENEKFTRWQPRLVISGVLRGWDQGKCWLLHCGGQKGTL